MQFFQEVLPECSCLGYLPKGPNKQGLYFGIGASIFFTAHALLTSNPVYFKGKTQLLLDLGSMNFTHHKYMIGVYSHLLFFVVGYVASLFFRSRKETRSLTYYGYLDLKRKRWK